LTADDRNMQLLGLHWAGAEEQVLQKLSRDILDRQRADGGWAQRSELESAFPYGPDQSISAMATGRATAAVAIGL